MTLHKPLLNQKGVTLLEIMFALGILIVGTYLTVEGLDKITDLSSDTRNMSTTERQVAMIVDNIRTGLGQYQINYNFSPEAKQAALNVNDLPMEWDAGVVRNVTNTCKTQKKCLAGRYGFVVQPMEEPRGLYSVTLRMTHREWKEPFRDYTFLVTVQ